MVVYAGALQGQGPLHHQPGIPLPAHSKNSLVLSDLGSVLCAACSVLQALCCVLCFVGGVKFAVQSLQFAVHMYF